MPGDDLLFQRLSVSTIGADWFHGRVRDGIGWDTDAMVTRQWSGRAFGIRSMVWDLAGIVRLSLWPCKGVAGLLVRVWILQA